MYKKIFIFLSLLASFMFFQEAIAGTAGAEFTTVYSTLTGWAQGSLGKIISLGMILVGLAMGIVQQSVTAVAVGIGGALALFYAPTVIDGIATAII